jgi:hexaprenyl-diphosphate synthase
MLCFRRTLFTTKSQYEKAIQRAEKIVGTTVINPRELLGKDLSLLTENIRKLLGSSHPVLNTISAYYFSKNGKHVRPLIVLLMSLATKQSINAPLGVSKGISFEAEELVEPNAVLPTQKRLAEITEMIHTASLLHDDVIDVSPTRRNAPSANAEFGNKMAILAGDFLLARASVALARLRNVTVVELLATVISNLVEGEFMQLRNVGSVNHIQDFPSKYQRKDIELDSRFDYYLEKTYLKTASLIARSCEAAAVLGNQPEGVCKMAYGYGRSLGLAFQVICIHVAYR